MNGREGVPTHLIHNNSGELRWLDYSAYGIPGVATVPLCPILQHGEAVPRRRQPSLLAENRGSSVGPVRKRAVVFGLQTEFLREAA